MATYSVKSQNFNQNIPFQPNVLSEWLVQYFFLDRRSIWLIYVRSLLVLYKSSYDNAESVFNVYSCFYLQLRAIVTYVIPIATTTSLSFSTTKYTSSIFWLRLYTRGHIVYKWDCTKHYDIITSGLQMKDKLNAFISNLRLHFLTYNLFQ